MDNRNTVFSFYFVLIFLLAWVGYAQCNTARGALQGGAVGVVVSAFLWHIYGRDYVAHDRVARDHATHGHLMRTRYHVPRDGKVNRAIY